MKYMDTMILNNTIKIFIENHLFTHMLKNNIYSILPFWLKNKDLDDDYKVAIKAKLNRTKEYNY